MAARGYPGAQLGAADRAPSSNAHDPHPVPRLTTLLLLPALAPCCATPADPPESGNSTTTGTSTPTSDTGAGDVTTGEVTAACETISQGCPEGQKVHRRQTRPARALHRHRLRARQRRRRGPPGGICINAADGSDTCDETSMCMQFGSGEGACLAFCGGPPDAPTCADPTMVCARVDRTWPINLCVPRCDPLAYDCPDLNFGATIMVCAPAAAGFGCVLRGNRAQPPALARPRHRPRRPRRRRPLHGRPYQTADRWPAAGRSRPPSSSLTKPSIVLINPPL